MCKWKLISSYGTYVFTFPIPMKRKGVQALSSKSIFPNLIHMKNLVELKVGNFCWRSRGAQSLCAESSESRSSGDDVNERERRNCIRRLRCVRLRPMVSASSVRVASQIVNRTIMACIARGNVCGNCQTMWRFSYTLNARCIIKNYVHSYRTVQWHRQYVCKKQCCYVMVFVNI
jgi:hypothetical protein